MRSFLYLALDFGAQNEEFTAFLPDAIARGFSVTWSAREKHHVNIRLLSPTAREEIRELHATVGRIIQYWNADLYVEGEKINLDRWMAGMDDLIDFNTRVLRNTCQKLIEHENEELTLFSAFWPLTVGEEAALRFVDDPSAFESWLHEKQSVDAYYASPLFYQTDEGIVGLYAVSEDCRSIFPSTPSVPFGLTDSDTGKQLVCNDFQVSILSSADTRVIGEIDFKTFIQRLPAKKISRYDERCILIEPLSMIELQKLCAD